MPPDDMPPDWYINLVENFHYLYFGIFVKSFLIFLNLCSMLSSKIYLLLHDCEVNEEVSFATALRPDNVGVYRRQPGYSGH